MFQDIRAALDIWLGISTTDKCSPDDKCFMVSENTMMLLYNIIDLLSIKVCLSTLCLGSQLKNILIYFWEKHVIIVCYVIVFQLIAFFASISSGSHGFLP